ncbi:hypothetical protein A2697_03330 [Candidatus Curtissbacteria bacterium RIFCSPHIGHO2_01_FULL_41_44]|uniref:Methyltransferase type 11 domain-containing protein n=1 Tax=Candidatus Curtissbacteria bacterium RIFCSPLOWO2_01_FULL_42_50 TaxID=1797730 RepID=A0A1F5H551_9BACT|nr:MAG: hypothetical protein A3C33_00205 [Candidatus Curtissbacteria bacterium RIFCSPHIGHO2_02_FULL_42_58]OGD93590.1 MAG: hypothetical protein A2697_03330 [Candidatus Curtissbacteria bacterium RIFCSPHIGHO2_01_FULL_41_44]OGD97351.1 MAG: hypothetical protein A3E71_04085 [Candidatus Curtissbacteria bacterium RIFCSPHIGHO2_12_FULL_42_33]OGD99231.1 MAG: hypothetical protein A3B54_01525 [Candidatus Curtissbacteria bacterium RIFCSPLOWO2_01_FULL_42_50]OGE03557.1 MAG: hypothetical protein A3G16_00760 [Ca
MSGPYQIRHKKIAHLAKGRILDVGYADHPNRFLKGDVTGLDLIKPKELPENYRKLVVGDALIIGNLFKANSFDTLIAAEIIEHLENPAQFLRGARQILKNNGILIISTPNPYHLLTLIANALFIRPEFTAHKTHDPYHINLFPYRNMVTLLEHCDFRVEKVISTGGLILNIASGPIIPFPKAFSQGFIYVVRKA